MYSSLIERLKKMVQSPTPKIAALQIEVSTLCQLSCFYCPRTVLAASWQNSVLPLELYKRRIAPHFSLFDMIFLQGWGEPLTHPNFWDMVTLAKQSGAKVGFLTNGILFDRHAAEKACELGVDLVAFTFAGAVAGTHEHYRTGADFAKLLDTIKMLNDVKAEKGVTKTVISISYTMMRGNIAEFPRAISLAHDLGATQVVASHMDCVPTVELEQEAIFLNPLPGDEEIIDAAARSARKLGMIFKAEPPHLSGEILVCEPNPLHVTLYVRVNGNVIPCHQMALRPESVNRLFFHGEAYEYQPLVMGNIAEESLPEIIAGPLAQNLYQVFDDRAKCQLSVHHQLPKVPEICTKCYKIYGV